MCICACVFACGPVHAIHLLSRMRGRLRSGTCKDRFQYRTRGIFWGARDYVQLLKGRRENDVPLGVYLCVCVCVVCECVCVCVVCVCVRACRPEPYLYEFLGGLP